MTVYDIITERDGIIYDLEVNYSMNSDLNDFVNRNCSELSKKYDIKESQAMFLVMSAINDFHGRYQILP